MFRTRETLDAKVDLLLRQNQIILRLLSKNFTQVLNMEDELMDVVKDVSDQVDSSLAVMASAVAEIQKDMAELAAIPADNTAAIEDKMAKLKAGTDALAAALPKAPTPVAPAEPAAPVTPAPATPVA